MHNRMNDFFINKLSTYQCGLRKGFAARYCLLLIIKKLHKIQDNKEVLPAVFTLHITVYSPFNCIPHELLIVKLNAYEFDTKSLNFILSNFTNQKQKAKIAFNFSDVLHILFSVVLHKVQQTSFFHHFPMCFVYGI